MQQQPLPFMRLTSQGPCAFGSGDPEWPGPHHCAQCAAAVDQARAWMRDAIARGDYDAAGFTPRERKHQQRMPRTHAPVEGT